MPDKVQKLEQAVDKLCTLLGSYIPSLHGEFIKIQDTLAAKEPAKEEDAKEIKLPKPEPKKSPYTRR